MNIFNSFCNLEGNRRQLHQSGFSETTLLKKKAFRTRGRALTQGLDFSYVWFLWSTWILNGWVRSFVCLLPYKIVYNLGMSVTFIDLPTGFCSSVGSYCRDFTNGFGEIRYKITPRFPTSLLWFKKQVFSPYWKFLPLNNEFKVMVVDRRNEGGLWWVGVEGENRFF